MSGSAKPLALVLFAALAAPRRAWADPLPPLPPPPATAARPPARTAPAAPPPAAPGAPGAPVEIRFQPAAPDLDLLSLAGEAPFERFGWYYHGWWLEHGYAPEYARVCEGPCVARFEPGEYHLALAKDGGPPVAVREPVMVRGPSMIRASYKDRSGLRAAGLAVGVLGLAGGVVMIAASARTETVCDGAGDCFERDRANGPLVAGGIGVILASAIVGTVLALQHDEAHVTLEPLELPSPPEARPTALADLRRSAAAAQGAALKVRF